MNLISKGALILTLTTMLGGCDFGQRQAKTIFSLSALPVVDKEKTGHTKVAEENKKVNLNELSRNEAIGVILTQDTIYYSEIVEVIEAKKDPSFTAEVISGLLLKSDRICKRYLFNIIDTRNGYKITNQALGSLPTILTVFGLPGTEILTIGRINSIQEGVQNSLTGIGIDENSLMSNLREIRNIRKKMKSAVHQAFVQNIDIEYNGVGRLVNVAEKKATAEDKKKAYTIFSALLDLETYHQACSLYEKTYFDFSENDKLSELHAYRQLVENKRLKVAEGT